MNSRMEKYYGNNSDTPSRMNKNSNLYDELYDNVKYTNVEGIASIEKSDEIDIEKIKKLIDEHDEESEANTFVRKTVDNINKDKSLEEKNYDLKEVLDDAKKNRPKEEKDRYAKQIKDDLIATKINELNDTDVKMDDLTNIASLSVLGDNELSLDLLDSLKSSDNTFIGDLSDRTKKQDVEEIDSSFYTSSMSFNKDDFEELDDINSNLKKHNVLIGILVFIIMVVVITGCLFLLRNMNII